MSGLKADYVAQDFDDPETGKKTVFWGDASGGKDAYVLRFDKSSSKYYFDKVEKNRPVLKTDAVRDSNIKKAHEA